MEKFFKIKEHGSTIKTEIIAGITTFMAMAYILMVNADMFTSISVSYGAVYIATALSAVIGTLCMGLIAKLPLALASGMGINAFFVYTVCIGSGLSYANALVLILLEGILFIVLTVTGLRKMLFEAIPDSVKKAIPAGIGLFIAFLGLQNAGIVVNSDATLVNLVSLNVLNGVTWAQIMPIIVTIVGVLFIAILSKRNVKGAVFWGIIGSAVVYYLLGFTVKGFYNGFADNLTMNPFDAFKAFGTESIGKVFTEGFDFSAYLAVEGHDKFSLVLVIITSGLAFCMVDMFDTMGTLYGACARGDMLDKDGNVPNMDKAMLADAIATTAGAVCGTSTVTTFVESSSGVAEGGRTGFAAVVTAIMFFIAMFLSPVASLIPGCATATALIYVGILMINCVTNIDWKDVEIAVPAFLTMAFMPFTYNVSYGIAFGLISHIIIKIGLGKIKEIKIGTWVIAILFAIMFFVTH
jgi:AGZA family xanthine/uracil permease-like MFS transporter